MYKPHIISLDQQHHKYMYNNLNTIKIAAPASFGYNVVIIVIIIIVISEQFQQ